MGRMDERKEFEVGGKDRKLSPEEQLEQLSTYIAAHYERPAMNPPWSDSPTDPLVLDTYDARLADRITHASMLMLGSALDHTTPGVTFDSGVTTEDVPNGQIIRPAHPTGVWGISLHPGGWWKGSGTALENAWRPEVAAVANLSGITFLDLDYPLLPDHTVSDAIASVRRAAQWVRSMNPPRLVAWGYSSGAALAALTSDLWDAQALTFPHLTLDYLPTHLCDAEFPQVFPPTFLQVATQDSVADRYPWAEAQSQVKEYVSEHRVATPEVMRERVKDVADFLVISNT
ncbi:Alpha/beta hydrolase family protein [Corynebacterium pseudotuberculosis 267]|uniref:alpha/beta hydrolase n=1 Tax=Corynebacterium pseudotuberculosis TaxID=1719 RepID=UPI0002593B28|nr:alpha/beta hydrolase [Corynebacterium pseudotuberculosis]AFH51014.1 Alpha/beta hydrolase family protein [Corynebacterium pseudotuberculosis 267]